MADDTLDALNAPGNSIPDTGVDDVVNALNEELEKPRDPDTGQFVAREPQEAAEDSEPVEAEAEAEDDTAPDEASGEDETEEVEPETAIEAPVSWPDEAKEAFAKLPPELQQVVAERESDRERGVNAGLAEAASQRKAAEAEREAAFNERQHQAVFLQQVAAYARTMDPIIAQGMNTDWAALAREEGADEAFARREEFNNRVQQLNAVEQELQRMQQANIVQNKQMQERLLYESEPDLSVQNNLSTFRESARAVLTDYGYSPQEVEQFWQYLPDHRQARIIKRLVELERAEKARKAIASKKQPAEAPKVQKPKAAQDPVSQQKARIAALGKQFDQNPHDLDVLTELAQRTIGAK